MNSVLILDMHRQGVGMATDRVRTKFLYARTCPAARTRYPNSAHLINGFFMPTQICPVGPHKPGGPI